MRVFRYLAAWLLIICVEMLHGVLRALFLVPWVGDSRSRQIGVFSGSALIVFIAYLLASWVGARSRKELLAAGLTWLVLTVAFELIVGHYVFLRSWQSLGEDYDLARGGLMPLGLVVLTLAPLAAARMRGIKESPMRPPSGDRSQ